MKKFLFVMLALTVLAMPAMASVQNIKVSGDIESTYLNRQDFDLGGGAANVYRQSLFLTQTRLRVDADLTDKVSATIAMINERAWGENTAASSDVDLNLAYVTMKEMLYSPLTVRIGRQDFAFGNSFVIDSAGTNNSAPLDSGIAAIAADLTKQTAQDAVRLTFDYNPLTIDVLYSKINQNDDLDGTIGQDDVDLYGVNLNYRLDDERDSVVEGYFWVKHDDSVQSDFNRSKADKVYMPGVRGSMNVADGWSLHAEAAMQFGNHTDTTVSDNYERRAYAAQVMSNYMLPFAQADEYQPVLGLAYTMYTGDSLPNSGKYRVWDPMFENQAGGKIYNTLFNATNSHTFGASLTMSPVQDVTTNVYYDYIMMDKRLDAGFPLVQPDGTARTPAGQKTDKKGLGSEVGMVVTYDYTEDVQFGARAGWFFPASHFASDATTASQLLLNAKVSF